ncbi:MAG: ATP-dependent Clp protease adaptor ClpS [bacterium]
MGDTVTTPQILAGKTTLLAPLYHVVLFNDDHHTFDYVIKMLGGVFGHHPETGCKGSMTATIEPAN